MVFTRKSNIVSTSYNQEIDQKIFIGTLGVNCVEYTKRMVASIQVDARHVRCVYIDNGSTKENVEDLKCWNQSNSDIHEYNLAFNGYNAGVSVGWNQLIRLALEWGADKIIICNNDIVFGPHTITGMVNCFDDLIKNTPETVMVTAANKTKNPDNLRSIPIDDNIHEHPDFSCFMIDNTFIDKVGLFNEDYMPAFFEDNDMHWRILLSGYKAFCTDKAPYCHVASQTRHNNPGLVTHENFRLCKIKFFNNMLTNSVDQDIAVARYLRYIEDYPEVKHPAYADVLSHSRSCGMISDELIEWLEHLTIMNVPN